MSEKWLPVLGYEGLYEVSSAGRVRSLSREVRTGRGTRVVEGRLLSPARGAGGYLVVSLSNGSASVRRVHHLVLEAFVGPRPSGAECCHGDGDRENNRLSNLRWDTHQANVGDMITHGTHWNVQKDRCKHGHPLEAPNLKPAQAAKGVRSCLSCAREYALARYQGRPFDPALADERLKTLSAQP